MTTTQTVKLCTKCGRPPAKKYLSRGLCENCYFTHRARQVAYGRWEILTVDAAPVRSRIETLRSLGIGMKRIAELAGIDKEIVRGIVRGRGGYPPVERVHRKTEERILAVKVPPLREVYRTAAPGARVPVDGTRRRLRALMRIGYTQTHLCSLISDSKYGHTALWLDKSRQTQAWIADRVAVIYTELENVPGPSDRARLWAAKRDWPFPIQWDEDMIDDPYAEPYTPQRGDDNVAIIERYDELIELGAFTTSSDLHVVAERLNVKPDSLISAIRRRAEKPEQDGQELQAS